MLANIGIETLYTKPLIDDFLNDKGFNQYAESPLVVSEKGSHPSALFHRMLAEYLALPIGYTIEKSRGSDDWRTVRMLLYGERPGSVSDV